MRLFWEEASSFITYGPRGWLKTPLMDFLWLSLKKYWEKLDSGLLFGLPTYQLWSLKIETNSIQIPILPVIWQMSQNWDKICVLYLLGDQLEPLTFAPLVVLWPISWSILSERPFFQPIQWHTKYQRFYISLTLPYTANKYKIPSQRFQSSDVSVPDSHAKVSNRLS